MTNFIARLEMIDKPLPPSPSSSSQSPVSAQQSVVDSTTTILPTTEPRRISRLPPINLTPTAVAESSCTQRYLYVAVRSGRTPGVYTEWREAEAQLLDYPDPVFKTFSTKMAAEAYVNGWNGAGRHSVPGSCPKPLREHLAMNFPSSVPLSAPSKRPSYHARLVASAPSLSALPETTELQVFANSKQSFRRSQVRISSPLRQQVDEEGLSKKDGEKANWVVGASGLLSPPTSPKDTQSSRSVMERQRPTARRAATESGLWSSTTRRELKESSPESLKTLSSPSSPAIRPTRISGMWADTVPAPASPPNERTEPDLAGSAPKFSRSRMKKAGVVMPTAAPRSNSSSSLRSRLSRAPSSTSISSVASSSSAQSIQTLRRPDLTPKNSQDRLSTLAETSRRELQLRDGTFSSGQLAPPRPAFMRRSPSASSVSSDSSIASLASMTSLTSASSAPTSSLESCQEETCDAVDVGIAHDLPPICTKSDGDATSQFGVESKPKRGGLFKRFSRALRMDKKDVLDSDRRGSM